MEVSGRQRLSELDLASDEDCRPCQPCQYSGKQTVSKGFCKECEEYVCGQCIKYHQSLKATRGHTILAVDEDFKPQGQTQSKNWNCEKHAEEQVKFFCPNHSRLGCNVCMVLEHKTCDVAYISNVAKDFQASDTFRKFSTQLSKFETDVETLKHTLNKNGENVDAFALREIETLKRFRDEINALLDKKETALLDRIKVLKKQTEHILESSKQGLQSIRSEFQAFQKVFNDKQEDSSKLFISYHLAHHKISELENQLHSIASESQQVQEYHFEKDTKLLSVLKSSTAFGRIALNEGGTDGKKTGDTNVVHHGIWCDGCNQKPIIGNRHKCKTCFDYDLCDSCMSKSIHCEHKFKKITGPVTSKSSIHDVTVHHAVWCDGSDQKPIIGNRHKCKTCFDYDLCESCMSKSIHCEHKFKKITGPVTRKSSNH
ncbi:transcription intermediary factor 1-beta-like [Mya arenaria]|uniref:transcription intermediary factor 1-beta-like n=1 Tax=Mya arenaria TaxID=6604 RepID=UPI0022E814C9|nr:transcription intermediary factor 1-beta-like [Mya arenaria]